jgi:type VI secretion system secreted protein Hcp
MKLKILLITAALAMFAITSTQASLDMFIFTENPAMPGEVTTAPSGGVCPVHCGPGAWHILSFSAGVSNPVSIHVGGGGAGMPNFTDIALQKFLDSASVRALLLLAQGGHFDKVYLSFLETGGPTPFLSYEIKLEEVYISSVSHGGSTGGDDRPGESVSLAYGKITWTYYPRPTPGNPNPAPITAFWDLREGMGG